MKKILFFALAMFLFCSCLDYGYSMKNDGMESYCEGKFIGYRQLVCSFKERNNPGENEELEFKSISDSVWEAKYKGYTDYDSRYDEYLDGARITVGKDSSITVIINGHYVEGEYDTHIFTPAPGVINDKGRIRIEVTRNGTPRGWGQLDFTAQDWDSLKITTGAY